MPRTRNEKAVLPFQQRTRRLHRVDPGAPGVGKLLRRTQERRQMVRWPPRLSTNEFPEGAQLFDSPLGRIACDHGGVQGAYRDTRNPVRMNASFGHALVDAGL